MYVEYMFYFYQELICKADPIAIELYELLKQAGFTSEGTISLVLADRNASSEEFTRVAHSMHIDPRGTHGPLHLQVCTSSPCMAASLKHLSSSPPLSSSPLLPAGLHLPCMAVSHRPPCMADLQAVD